MRKNALLLIVMSVAVALTYWVVAGTGQVPTKVRPSDGLAMPDRAEESATTAGLPKGDTRAPAAVEAEISEESKEPSAAEARRAARLAAFRKYNDYTRPFRREMVRDPNFSRKLDSVLSAMRKWIIKTGLTAEDIRREIARLKAEGGHFDLLIVAMPYSKGASAEDLAAIQALAKSSTEATALMAMHALTTFQYYMPDAGEAPLWDVANSTLDRLQAGNRSPEAAQAAALALKLMDKLEDAEQAARIEALVNNPDVGDEVRGSALELLARAGGSAGAQRALTALSLGDPAALDAVRAIRDPSVATELQALAAQPLTDTESIATAAAALSGLVATKPETALGLLGDSILPRFRTAKGDEKQQLTDLVTQALDGISDTRDAGTVKLLAHLLGEDDVIEFQKLPKAWQEAMGALSSRTMTKAFNLPSGARREEICRRYRAAIEQLPPESGIYLNALYQLIRIGRPEDLQYIEDNLDRVGNSSALRESLDRRYLDDQNGTVSLSR